MPVVHTKKVNKYVQQPPHYIYKTRYKTITRRKYVPVPVPTPGKTKVLVQHVPVPMPSKTKVLVKRVPVPMPGKTKVLIKHVVERVPVPKVLVKHVVERVPVPKVIVKHVVEHVPVPTNVMGHAVQVSTQNLDHIQYDCEAGHMNSKYGWSESKKRWCCSHFQKGCSFSSGCETPCTLAGQQAEAQNTCASSTRWAARSMFAGRNDACQLAFHEVAMNCAWCHGCELREVGCKAEPLRGMQPMQPHPLHKWSEGIHVAKQVSTGRHSSGAQQEHSHPAFRCDSTHRATWSLGHTNWQHFELCAFSMSLEHKEIHW